MLPALVLAAAAGVPSCWDIFDTALRHSAMAQHPAYVSYDEHISITQDDRRLVESVAHVDYRDDGMARVRDERFNFEPILTRHEEPGPPELGPYGRKRDLWLPQEQVFPTIATVRSEGNISCRLAGVETYKDHKTYELDFENVRRDRPSLQAMWVDTRSYDIWKLVVSGYVTFADDPGATPGLANFEVELGYSGQYLVVDHVVWDYSRREYSQSSHYFGEYTLSDYTFPGSLPASYFADAAISP